MINIQFLPYILKAGSRELKKSSTGIVLMNYRILDSTYIQGKCGSALIKGFKITGVFKKALFSRDRKNVNTFNFSRIA